MARRDGNKGHRRDRHVKLRAHLDDWTVKLMRELASERDAKQTQYRIAVKTAGEGVGVGMERYQDGQLTWFASLWWAGRLTLAQAYKQAIDAALDHDSNIEVIVPLRRLDGLKTAGVTLKQSRPPLCDRAFELATDATRRRSSVSEALGGGENNK